MYSESDLAQAVEAGVLTPEQAESFRNHIAAGRSAPAVDEEHFRLLTGFNDIFVAIAALLILVAGARIGAYIGEGIVGFGLDIEDSPRGIGAMIAGGGFTVAVTGWLLAEYFTRKRRMALPSILLLLAFVGGFGVGLAGIFVANVPWLAEQFGLNMDNETQMRRLGGSIAAIIGVATAAAAWVHWKRFMVPITVAAGALAVVGIAIAMVVAFFPGIEDSIHPVVLVAGILVFALAMWWDTSDRERRTRRSDVAFWLHLAAAPLIANPIFHMLGVFEHDMAVATAVIVIALYIAFAIVALAIDRRALLVSSLAYVLWAMYALFNATQNVELSASLTALVIGSALLTLSAFWHPMRRAVLGPLGGLGEKLPPAHYPVAA
jgi:MFS family permease